MYINNPTPTQRAQIKAALSKDKIIETEDGNIRISEEGLPYGAHRVIAEIMKEDKPALLGKQTPLPESPDKAIIDTVPNKNYGDMFVARFSCPEFTSTCPVTGQPDYARIYIDYIPGERMIESKALKLFLGSFRNHGAFHEECTMMIKDRLIDALSTERFEACPVWFRIAAYWYPRGGIPIDVFWQTDVPPPGVLIPDLPKLDFTGR